MQLTALLSYVSLGGFLLDFSKELSVLVPKYI